MAKTKEELSAEKEQLKKKYKPIFELTIPLDDDGKTATIFLKKPGRVDRSMLAKMVEKDAFNAIEAAIKKLRVGGDAIEEILKYEDAIPACESAIVEIFKVQEAVLKKN